MPKTQTLMLYFDVTKAPGRDGGEFAPDDAQGKRSKVWLDDAGNSQPDSQPLNVAFNDNVDFSIQVTPNSPAGSTVANLRITVALWRVHAKPNDAKYDSPFVDAKGKQQTVFDQNFPAAAGASTVHPGVPKLKSYAPGNHDRYIFLVTVMLDTVDQAGNTSTFTVGHDPQMSIGL